MDRVELRVELSIGDLERSHPAHQAAVEEFIDYANETPGVEVARAPIEVVDGTKGSWEPLVLAIASPTAAVTAFRLWLNRDRKRWIKAKITSKNAAPVEVEVSGENISLDSLKAAVDSAIKASRNVKQ